MAVLIGACSNSERGVSQQGSPKEAPWFCELAENETDWQCVQNAAAADAPKPARLPRRQMPDVLSAAPSRRSPSEPRIDPASSTPAIASADEPRQPNQPAARPALAEDVPLHVALAYRPGKAQRLIELPGEFWAVQLAAFGSPEQLSEYAARHQLRGMSAARIARNNQLFYVLLLGVYETRENAERASATVPEALNIKPWIRSLASLQRAMRAGEMLQPAE